MANHTRVVGEGDLEWSEHSQGEKPEGSSSSPPASDKVTSASSAVNYFL
jgi:hypothetical protein